MQSKLVIASLAAMAHQAHAVNSFSKDQSSSDPASTLIGYYQNCQVQISNLTGSTSTMGDQLKLTPSFDFTGIDENCPELTATVWMEAPAICATNDNCPAEGMEVVISPEDIKNGSWSHDFMMNSVAGAWYAHVTVSPYGFECAMALTDGCTEIDATPACAAVVTQFVGGSKATPGDDVTYIDEAGHYYGPDGVTHTLNWGISALWNCNKCASFSVTDESGQSTVSSTMDAAALLQFSGDSSISTQLSSYTSYWPWTYTLDLFDCDASGDVPEPTPTPSPDAETYGPVEVFPACEIPCSVVINSVSEGASSTTRIDQTATMTPTYTCEKLYPYWFQSTMNHDDQFSANLHVTNGTQSVIDNVDNYNMTWANFPIWVNSTVEIQDVNTRTMFSSCSAQTTYWPDCVVSMSDPTFTASIVDGTDIDSHKLDLQSSFIGNVGPYCPTFDAAIVYTRETATVSTMNVDSVLDGVKNSKSVQTAFNDGKWCAQATMTAESTKPGEDAIFVEGDKICQTIVAPPCVLLAATSVGNIDGDVANSNYMLTITADASYRMNVWCSAADLTYAWGWLEPTTPTPYVDFEADGFPYQAAIAANQTVTVSETLYESDVDMTVLLSVLYTSTTFDSQDDVSISVNDTFTHTTTCRPMFDATNVPKIKELVINADSIDLVFAMQTATKGYSSCVDLVATISVYDVEDSADRLISSTNLTEAELYQNGFQGTYTNMTISALPKENSCFMVSITYGQSGKVASQVQASTGQSCWWSKCVLTKPSIALAKAPAPSADGNTINWAFDTSVVGNEYCSTYNQEICIKQVNSTNNYCTTVDGQTATGHEVMQTGNFGEAQWEYSVIFTSQNSTIATSDDTAYTMLFTKDSCKFNFTSDLEAQSDTLNTVSIKQNTNVNKGLVCGDSTQQFVYNKADGTVDNSTASNLESHTWTLASTSGKYCFSTVIVFSNFPQFPQQTADICQTWIQGCEVQVSTLSMTFVAANANTDIEASANVVMAGVAMGDCGAVDVVATLTGSDNSSYSLTVTDDFYSAAGQTVNQVISRTQDTYTVVVDMSAPLAQSVASHQNMTTGSGFVNILDDSDTTFGVNMQPVCNVVASSITWVSYAEVSDYTGPMVATYSGVVTAELSCVAISANLRIKDNSTSAYFNQTDITLVPSGDGSTYTWTETIYGQNIYHSPIGKIQVWDSSNAADIDSAKTDQNLWAPPCYLVIDDFKKTGQIESADQLRTVLDYNIQIAHFGDQACKGVDATISLQSADGITNTFSMVLDDADLEVALSASGFNVSIQTEASEAAGATLVWTDPRAVLNQTAPADGFVAPTNYDCSVQIFDFCLTDAAEISQGRWAFNFTIRIEQNSQCGALSATMDLIEDGSGAFLTGVSLDGAAMIDSFNCDCAKTFTVEADYDGAADSIYGQIDVRNGQQQIVQVMDSCTYEI